MRLVLLVLFSLSSFAVPSLRARLAKIKDIRGSMIKCGYTHRNTAIFENIIVKNNDVAKVECLESKQPEIKAEIAASKAKIINKGLLRVKIKNADCSVLTGYIKDVCEYLK